MTQRRNKLTMKLRDRRDVHRRHRIVESSNPGEGISLSPNSVDTQIDSLLITFENKSTVSTDEQDFSECFDMGLVDGLKLFERYLNEAEEDQKPDEEADDDSVTTDAAQVTDEPAEPLTPKININSYTSDVAMLIETYIKRLDVETVIYNRARNYIVKNHGEDAAVQFDNTLVNEHDIDLRTGADTRHLDAVAPPAVGAGPAL